MRIKPLKDSERLDTLRYQQKHSRYCVTLMRSLQRRFDSYFGSIVEQWICRKHLESATEIGSIESGQVQIHGAVLFVCNRLTGLTAGL